jgi:SAM-dependent methyltransferase
MSKRQVWAPKIFTPLGFVKTDILNGRKALDIGCGQKKLPGAVGLDILKNSQADIVHDISDIPWPLENNSFDIVLANNIIEHVDDVLGVLGEIHRVSKPGARIVIQVPYFRAPQMFTDPTHKRFFTSFSMDYVVNGTKLSEYNYVPFRFKKIGFWYGYPHPSKNFIKRFIKNLLFRNHGFYDKYLSLLFSVPCLTWELEVLKGET